MMNRFALLAALLVVAIWAASCGHDTPDDLVAPSTTNASHSVDEAYQTLVASVAAGVEPDPGTGGSHSKVAQQTFVNQHLEFFDNRNDFDAAACSDLPIEDFEEGDVPDGSLRGFPAPLNSSSNNAAFSPGDILPGIEFLDEPGPDDIDGLVLVGAGFVGNASKNIVANTFTDTFVVNFTEGDVTAAGMDLVSYFNAGAVEIQIIGESGLLGAVSATATPQGLFWGVVADEPITQIRIYSLTNEAEGVDNIAFGTCNAPPDCAGAFASPDRLFPPNHKMVDVEILGVVDPEGDPVSITITGVTQDEPVNGLGDGDTAPDAAGIGSSTARIRVERASPGNGRVYEISFVASDGKGGECAGSVTVCVPHDQGRADCVDDGQMFMSDSMSKLGNVLSLQP